ncbi:hypothetical protein K493DRAFT_369790 [Basidiobolus meristosporus CBS 931.73]|uniref:Uncharacterized protein n=1 Tax=Basidiobolus meristosporus CBS 931.73 TaxID=1314790 RepID=A0A1Y1YH56_9FUNG|nr:hypothetical protein K493DRAFT_369790 [Basidiobolus meristosporus CBS 931.73]|eukprot:ORX97371.1 hypothetical protein K493DRAFT_369790 [Basidiobolus meristosporus CBS 931.73]
MLIRTLGVQSLFYATLASILVGSAQSIYDVSSRISNEYTGSCAELDDRSMAVVLPFQQVGNVSYHMRLIDPTGSSKPASIDYGGIEPILVPIRKATLVAVLPSSSQISSQLVSIDSVIMNRTTTIHSGSYGLITAAAFRNLYDGYAVSWTSSDNLSLAIAWLSSNGALVNQTTYRLDLPASHIEATTTFDGKVLLAVLLSNQNLVRLQVVQIDPLVMGTPKFSIIYQNRVDPLSPPTYQTAKCEPIPDGSGLSCIYLYRELVTTTSYRVTGVVQAFASTGSIHQPLARYQLDMSTTPNTLDLARKKPQLSVNPDGSWTHIELGGATASYYDILPNGTTLNLYSVNASIICPNLNHTWYGVRPLPSPRYGWESAILSLNSAGRPTVNSTYPFSYTNPLVVSTNPEVNSVVEPRRLQFGIKYGISGLSLGVGYIRVYCMSANGRVPREVINVNSPRVQFSNDTIQLDLLTSSLNSPNAQYIIEMDDGAVRSGSNEPLPGINGPQQIWRVVTGLTTILVELTVNGSIDPFADLGLISRLIPVDISRLEFVRVENQPAPQPSKMRFKIHDSSEPDQLGASDAFQDFQNIVQNSNVFQLISSAPFIHVEALGKLATDSFQSWLYAEMFSTDDTTYAVRWGLISAAIILVALIILFVILRRKYTSSQNEIIFSISFGLFGLVFDLLFIIVHGGDISHLRVLLGIFFICPYIIHALASSAIIIFEISRNTMFWLWFGRRPVRNGILATLSFTKIENLRLLDSHFCQLEILSAPFSDWALKWISIIGFTSIFFQDIPKLVLLVGRFRVRVLSVAFPVRFTMSLHIRSSITWTSAPPI